jgi:hypothetical protein
MFKKLFYYLTLFIIVYTIYSTGRLGLDKVKRNPTVLIDKAAKDMASLYGKVCSSDISFELNRLRKDIKIREYENQKLKDENKNLNVIYEKAKNSLKERQDFKSIEFLESKIREMFKKLTTVSKDYHTAQNKLNRCQFKLQDLLDNGKPDSSFKYTEKDRDVIDKDKKDQEEHLRQSIAEAEALLDALQALASTSISKDEL